MVETWEDLKLSPASVNKEYLDKIHLLLLSPPEQDINPQVCLEPDKTEKGQKSEDTSATVKGGIAPEDI